MDKEEKEVKKVTKKTTTTKKSSTKKPTNVKKETKSVTKNATSKASTTKVVKKVDEKTTSKKPTVKKSTNTKPKTVKKVEKIEKIVEVPVIKEEAKEQKVVTNTVPAKKFSSELLKIRKKRYIIEAVIIAILVIVALLFLFNRTFLKTNYKTDTINVDIPRFSYYMKDKDNKVKLFTLRKSDYLKEYYNEYLEGFVFYSCAEGNNTFYYNEETKTLIKEIKIEKKFAIKTIEITYDTRIPEEVCGLR